MEQKRLPLFLFLALLIVALPSFSQKKSRLNKHTFGEIKARDIGPAVMSGRIATLDAVDEDPRIIYIGAASGGIWKSKNAGTTFKAVFDDHIQSIGAITIDQQHPDTVWAGTGECWTRNSISVGNGIYMTLDGGEKWEKMGLDETERIAGIKIHPENPDIVYVAAMGHLWNANQERGVYKTTDGGLTWEKILYVDENTGCSDLAMDPENPDILYAAMWDYRRKPWNFRSGGPGSGLYITRDGGKKWQKIEDNMPEGTLGRIAVAVSPADPNIVWAVVEAKETALYRSTDKGESWEVVSTDPVLGMRPFYFALLIPDPVDTSRIYKPGFTLRVSDDDGRTWTVPFVGGGNVHSDLHAMYISPKDNNFIYVGTDGGLYLSHDRGNTWKMIRNLPLSQFYRISIDNDESYNVYGGLQDNGSWYGPAKSPGGITNRDWDNIGYGDGFNVLRDPNDPNILYWQYQGGKIKRHYSDTREFKDIKPFADDETEELRFNWNAPLVTGPSSKALYVGSQYLYKSENMGDTWKRISPDLTTDDPLKQEQEETGGLTIDNSTAENHCTIYAVAESPLDEDIVWVGTDDGNIQITTNGGDTWTNVTANVPGLPAATWCSYICAGNFEEGTAYVTFDGHRHGDKTPYIYKTSDFGQNWTSLADDNIPIYCQTIKEDLVNPDLLFLGTEFGLYVSIDGGNVWTLFSGDLPQVSIREIAIHPTKNDLVIGTHGRGIMIIDDITPLRGLNTEMLEEDLVFLGSRPYSLSYLGIQQRMEGDDGFSGSNPSGALKITYYLKKRHIFGDMYMELYNEDGDLIKTLPAGKRKGINRVLWNIRMDPPKIPSSVQFMGAAMAGPTYPPGDYTVKIIKGEDTYESKVTIEWASHPRHSEADRDLRHEILMKTYNLIEDLAYIDAQIIDIRDKCREKAKETSKKSLQQSLNELADQMGELRKEILATKEGTITGEIRLRERLGTVYGGVMGYLGKPTDSQIERLDDLELEVNNFAGQVAEIIDTDLVDINKKLSKARIDEITVISRGKFMEEE